MGKLKHVAGSAVLVSLVGCSGVTSYSCDVFIDFVSPQEQYENADLVLVGMKAEREEGSKYTLKVESVLKGELDTGVVEFEILRDRCGGGTNELPLSTVLEDSSRVLLFANDAQGTWVTLTPYDGIVEYEPGASLPLQATLR